MILNEFIINCKGREPYYIIGLGDLHYGTESFNEEKLKHTVEWIRNNPRAYWIGLGDYCELISYRDMKRFDPQNIDKRFMVSDLQGHLTKQIDRVSNILMPIANRCIGLCDGNHEYDALRNYDCEATARLCQNLNTKHLGWTSLTRIKFRRTQGKVSRVIMLLAEHSNVGGRKKGNKINRIEDRVGDFSNVDIILWGHSHDKVASKKTQLYMPKKGKMILLERTIVCAIVPSYYNTYIVGSTSYGERRGYSPTSTGVLLIEVIPWEGQDKSRVLSLQVSQ